MKTKTPAKKSKTSAETVRHRTLPSEVSYIKGYPEKLFIYRLPASPFWWVRYYIAGKTVRRSTKQEGKQQAFGPRDEVLAALQKASANASGQSTAVQTQGVTA